MSAQESLTFLFNAIALSFIFIATIDLGQEIISLYKQVFITPVQLPLINSQPQQLPQLPDPWFLPAAEAVAPEQITQVQPNPLLLLAEASLVEEMRVPLSEVTIEELLRDIDINTVKLREARKIAKALGIAQKVNGKDQKLDWLRALSSSKTTAENFALA